jgi:PKD repeat protein
VNPLNITYNLFGKTMSAEEGFLLNVIPEEPLLWMAYSLDGQSMVPFSGSTLIPTPEEEGLHSILVFGINFEAELFESEMRYFSIKYPITIFSPENKTYFEFGEGLMLDFTSVKKLNSISYSLDGQDPISISGDITLPFPSIGAHSIVVNGTDIYGNEYCSAIRYFTIGINLWPEAEFEANVQTIVAGQSVSFMFLGFEGNPAATYSWDFGDGSNSNNQNPTHMYESSGIFTVTLTVTDNDDDVDIEIKSNYITVNPNQVTGLTATGGRNVISLSWSSSADSNFHHYNIYRNGVKLAETTSNSYTYSGLPDSTTYTFQVSAVNTAGMEGEKSNPVSATTLPPPPPDPVPVPGFTDSVMLASLILGVIAVLLRFHKKQQKIKQQK